MPVFVSWAGLCSRQYADVVQKWIRQVVPGETVFFSSNMSAGTIGLAGILGALEKATFGVLCLTPDNLDNGWLHFEAGAILNNLGSTMDGGTRPPVVPLLCHGVSLSSLKEPLKMLQAKPCDEDGLWSVAEAINVSRGDRRIDGDVLKKQFQLLWTELSNSLNSIRCDGEASPEPPHGEEQVEVLAREIESLKQITDTVVASKWQVLRRSAIANIGFEFTQQLRERADRSGHVVQSPPAFGPDLLIDGRVIVEVKALRDSANVMRRFREGMSQLEKWRLQYPESEAVLAIVGAPLRHPPTGNENVAFLWSIDGTTIFGNKKANEVCSYLLDEVAPF